MYAYISLSLIAAYLLGALPFGLILAGLRGVDIRKAGSGNIGATNVFRSVSKPLGILTFFLDFLKGFVPAFFFPLLLYRLAGIEDPSKWLALGCGAAAIAGHNWPVYLRFKGGKGVATSAGMLAGVFPPGIAIGLVVWILCLLLSGYVSLASILAALLVGLSGWLFFMRGLCPMPVVVILSALSILVIARHAPNIRRLCNGTEHRFRRFGRRADAKASDHSGS